MPVANGIDMYHGDLCADTHLSGQPLIDRYKSFLDAGVFWIFHKVSQGTTFVDPSFLRRRDAARKAGFKFFGGYHFLTRQDVNAQLDFFIEHCHDDNEMAFAVDFERNHVSPTLRDLKSFMILLDTEFNANSKIYSGDYIREILKPSKNGFRDQQTMLTEFFFAKKDLWLAEYGPHENIPFPWNDASLGLLAKGKKEPPGSWAWQFTDRGMVDKIGSLDLNYFAGTETDMETRWR